MATKTPMEWIESTLKHAVFKLYEDTNLAATASAILEYHSAAIEALGAGNPVPAKTPAQTAAFAALATVTAMQAQFQSHLAVISSASYVDENFWLPERWLDPTPPLTEPPAPEGNPVTGSTSVATPKIATQECLRRRLPS